MQEFKTKKRQIFLKKQCTEINTQYLEIGGSFWHLAERTLGPPVLAPVSPSLLASSLKVTEQHKWPAPVDLSGRGVWPSRPGGAAGPPPSLLEHCTQQYASTLVQASRLLRHLENLKP